MGMTMKLDLKGTKEMIQRIEHMSDAAVTDAVLNAAEAGGKVLVEGAKRRAPVKTGKLRDSITSSVVSSERGRAEISVGPGKDGYYGVFLERGTSRMRARPFLRPTLDEDQDRVIAAARDAMWKEILGAIR